MRSRPWNPRPRGPGRVAWPSRGWAPPRTRAARSCPIPGPPRLRPEHFAGPRPPDATAPARPKAAERRVHWRTRDSSSLEVGGPHLRGAEEARAGEGVGVARSARCAGVSLGVAEGGVGGAMSASDREPASATDDRASAACGCNVSRAVVLAEVSAPASDCSAEGRWVIRG